MKWKFPLVAPAPVASSLQRPPLPFRSSSGDADTVPIIESVSFQGSTIRSGGVAVARLRGRDIDPDGVRCDGANAGFVDAGIDQRGERHVAADSGRTVQVGDFHGPAASSEANLLPLNV